jgi:hypothetical protein
VRVAAWVLGAAVVAVPLAVGHVLVSEWRELRKLGVSRAVEQRILDSLEVDRRELRARVKEVGEEVKALPESARLGRAMRATREIAKQEGMINGRLTASGIRIRGLDTARERRERRMATWAGAGGAGWILVLLALAGLRWRQGRGRKKGPGEGAQVVIDA